MGNFYEKMSEGASAERTQIFKTAEYQLNHPPAVDINTTGAYIDVNSHNDKQKLHISLPNQTEQVLHVSMDIGGTLCKVVYFKKYKKSRGGRLIFEKFQTSQLGECLDFLSQLVTKSKVVKIVATGGGAFKYYDQIKDALQVEVQRADEMQCLITGASFFARNIPQEIFCYNSGTENPIQFTETPSSYPWLLINIGSGVSMLKISSPTKFERIGGSSLGGGTLWGLLSILTECKTFDEMLATAEAGDNRNVDMMVGDIYGTGYSRIGLKSTAIASSFGKVFKNPAEEFSSADISRSLLYAISNNIAQLAFLQAKIHGAEHVFFGGSYIRGHPQTMETLAYAINFWSQGVKKAYFFRHEGYLGAVGAFLDESGELGASSSESDSSPEP